MRIYPIIKRLYPRHVFRIARGPKSAVDNVFLVLEENGILAYGEASPNKFYGESASDIWMNLMSLNDRLRPLKLESQSDIEEINHICWPLLAPSHASQCALDIALWDLWAKKQEKSLSEILWGEKAKPLTTSLTLGLSQTDEIEAKILELENVPVIKMKVNEQNDETLIRLVQKRTGAQIRIDANCGWENANFEAKIQAMKALNVEFIEQPFAPENDSSLADCKKENIGLPIVADESCVLETDVPKLANRYHGINIKLVKCGGITPALRMLKMARSLNLDVMMGCMLESSCLISAAFALAQKTKWADLDGAWLLAEDPFNGLPIQKGIMQVPQGFGLGVNPLTKYTEF